MFKMHEVQVVRADGDNHLKEQCKREKSRRGCRQVKWAICDKREAARKDGSETNYYRV